MPEPLSNEEREALADACDAALDFGSAWIRFLRNGDESMLLPVIEDLLAARVAATEQRVREEVATWLEGDEAVGAVWGAVVDVRDASPRLHDDADSHDVATAATTALAEQLRGPR